MCHDNRVNASVDVHETAQMKENEIEIKREREREAAASGDLLYEPIVITLGSFLR